MSNKEKKGDVHTAGQVLPKPPAKPTPKPPQKKG